MPHAGLLAHTPEGAALCYLEFCRCGSDAQFHPDVTLDHIAFGHSAEAWNTGDHGAVRAILARSITRLKDAGAEFFFCPANTAHIALEAPGAPLALPGLHIADVVAAEAARNGWRKVGLLATSFTVASNLYQRALGAHGVSVATPSHEDQQALHALIFEELVRGDFTEAARQLCTAIVDKFAQAGCDAAALACTELPLLLAPSRTNLPLIDSTRLLATSAFAVASGAAPLPVWRGGAYDVKAAAG